MENFEKATKLRLRWETSQGQLSVEDLWDLKLDPLDVIAKSVYKKLQNEGEESFIPSKRTNKPQTYNDLRLDILKYIIDVKVEEEKAKALRAERKIELARLKEVAANKADEQLSKLDLEDLRKKISALETELV